ncbi:MAG TPA: NEL-type E3 ubiquitin ligase domain-containing protein, partial [Burkholderiaceae bacterium]|nr:NEL-type E3 ubiquitin ligase domain-containing protein [Burkholderiaceae bacterium]
LLERYGSPHALAAAGFRTAMTTEFERAWSARRAGMRLQADLARQVRPLSEEIRSWLLLSNDLPGSDRIHPGDELTEFDTEDCAPAFARVLARMQLEMATSGTASHQRRAATLWEGSQMIRAISEDARLRQSVFHLAIAALGDCGDAVVDGFSAMVSEVRRHQIVDGIRKGRMDLQQLDDWMRREFRLQKLEEAVEQFIEAKLTQPHLRADIRRNLTIEPLESMLHAKVALRDRLALPDHTPSGMANRSSSVLTESDLQDLVKRVREQESNQEELLNFMLAKQSWRDGVKELYKQEFETLEAEFEEDPFHDLPLPPIDDTHVAEMTKYNEAAAEYAKRKDNAEKAILSRIVQDWPENRGSPESILLARQLIEPFLGAGTVSSSSSPDRLCDLPETSHRSTDYNAPSTAAR